MVLHSAVTCEGLRFHVKEDILGLLQLVQVLQAEEVAEIQRLVKLLPTTTKNLSTPAARRPSMKKHFEPHAIRRDDLPAIQNRWHNSKDISRAT